ncbi:MAG: carbohydrate porin [Alphaproteobacteria bacterium]|nr:carbohydrate porin [Alphaproteobacteria bacterium]
MRIGAKLAVVLALLFWSTAVCADPSDKPQQSWLLGDLGGRRTRLLESGVDLQLSHVSELAYNASGGVRQMADYTDQVAFGATLDLDRLFGLHDARFHITYTERAGRNLVDDAQLGSLQLVQEVYGRGQTVRLTEMWFEQEYFNRTVSLKLGRMGFGGDFASFPCDFQNLTFCGAAPGNLVGGYIFNWPISQWASRVKVKLGDIGYAQVGVYDQNQQYLGFDNKLWPVWYWGSSGVMVPVEIGFEPKFAGGWLEGSYKFGGWYSSGQQPDAVYDNSGNFFALSGQPPAVRQGLYGGYVSFQQQLIRTREDDPHSGLRLFFNATFADAATAATDRQLALGFWYTGPFKSRPHDVVGFAMGTTHLNQRVTQVANLQNAVGLGPVPAKDSEYVFELGYTFVPTPGVQIRPNVQYVYSPGAGINENVWVLGLKTVINF